MSDPPKKEKKENGMLFLGSGMPKSKDNPKVRPASPDKFDTVEDMIVKDPTLQAPDGNLPPKAQKKLIKKLRVVAKKKEKQTWNLRDKLRQTFSGKKKNKTEEFKDKLKEAFSERTAPSGIANWNTSHFAESRNSTDNDAAVVSGGYFLAAAKKRPILALIGLMTVLVIFAVDLLVLARHLNLTQWNPVGYDGDTRPVTEASRWESRQTALSLLDRGAADAGEDERTLSALQGSNQLAGGLIQPKLPAGLGGILNPSDAEDSKRLKKVKGVELNATGLALGGPAANMNRTMVAYHVDEEEEMRNYQGPFYKSGGVEEAKVPRGVYFGEAGDNLENYASISNSPKGSAEFKAPDRFGSHPTAPEGTTEAELAHAMIGDGFLEEIRQYAKEGTWRMKRHDGSAQRYDEIDGNALYTSFAAGQLFQAQNENNKVMKCGQCTHEKRVYQGRATFYGERY